MHKFLATVLCLLPGAVLAQTVPFGPLTNGTVWTVQQWNQAWADKVDTSNGQLVGTGTSALVGDQAQLTAQMNGASAGTIFQDLIGCSSCYNADAIRGAITAISGTTTTNTNAIAGYVLDQNASGGLGQNAVALFGVGIAAANGAETWGVNTNLTDNTSLTPSSGSGRSLFNEFDFNVTSSNTTIIGLVVQGNSVAQPSAASGFVVSPLKINTYSIPWNNAFVSSNGGATTALLVGTSGSPLTPNASSQAIAFVHTNSAPSQLVDELYDTPSGLMINASAFSPSSSNTTNLGTSSLYWQNAYLSVVWAGGKQGATCSGSPSASFATIGGIVTHC